MQTPVDLQSYTTHLSAKGAAAEPAAASRLTIARRPALDLPFGPARGTKSTATAAGSAASAAPAEDHDLNMELDVPAFLRRSEG
jgi:hypothetical protein